MHCTSWEAVNSLESDVEGEAVHAPELKATIFTTNSKLAAITAQTNHAHLHALLSSKHCHLDTSSSTELLRVMCVANSAGSTHLRTGLHIPDNHVLQRSAHRKPPSLGRRIFTEQSIALPSRHQAEALGRHVTKILLSKWHGSQIIHVAERGDV